MEVLFVLFVVLVVWLYFRAKQLDEQGKKRQQKVSKLYEDQKKIEKKIDEFTSSSKIDNNGEKERIRTRENSSRKQSFVPSKTTSRSTHISQSRQAINEGSQKSKESLDTGIPELDGPGMFHRLLRLGPSASAVYLLYSKQHTAYKVGYC